MQITSTQLKAMIASKRIHDQIVSVWSNIFYNKHSVGHITNRFGEAVLAFRIRDNALQVTDRSGNNVTELFLSVNKELAK